MTRLVDGWPKVCLCAPNPFQSRSYVECNGIPFDEHAHVRRVMSRPMHQGPIACQSTRSNRPFMHTRRGQCCSPCCSVGRLRDPNGCCSSASPFAAAAAPPLPPRSGLPRHTTPRFIRSRHQRTHHRFGKVRIDLVWHRTQWQGWCKD